MTKTFTVIYNSAASGRTVELTVEAELFHVEQGFVVFTNEANQPIAAFQSAHVDSVKTDAAKEKANG